MDKKLKAYIERLLDDAELISGVTVDYSLGRHRGLTDEQIEKKPGMQLF